MDNIKVGNVIRTLRLQRSMTQKQLAEQLHISDKTVSKWERGLGCPDIAFIPVLANYFEVDIQRLLIGDITPNDLVGGNMKNTKFYVCPTCTNISMCTGDAEISCCGKKIPVTEIKKAEVHEKLKVEVIEDEWFISSDHPMTKADYITFIAFVTGDRVQMIKQYPEWNLSLRIQKNGHGKLLWHSFDKGLLYQLI